MLQVVAFAGTDLLPQLDPFTADHPALCWEYSPEVNRQRTVTSHLQPIWHIDADGKYQRNVVDMQDDGTGYYENRMPVQFRADHDGRAVYKIGNHVLRMVPLAARVWDDGETTLREKLARVPSNRIRAASNIIKHMGMFGDDVEFEYRVSPGTIKEYVTLPTKPDLSGASKSYVIVWQYASPALTPELIDGAILWKTGTGRVLFRNPAPDVWDNDGAHIPSRYRIGTNYIAVIMPVSALNVAIYPVVIDPTTTTSQADALANRTTRDNAPDDLFKSAYCRFNLPDISGGTVSAADLQLNAVNAIGSVQFSVQATDVGFWDESTLYPALEALSFDTATLTGQSISSTGQNNFDVTGSVSNGIIKAYNASATIISTKLNWTNGGGPGTTVDSQQTAIILGEQFNPAEQIFRARIDATNYPRLNVTFDVAGGGTPYHYDRRRRNN